jgi:hypothetical protein
MKNMREYPIFKHLIQFSNIIDDDGNIMENYEAEQAKMEQNKIEEKSEDEDSPKVGG